MFNPDTNPLGAKMMFNVVKLKEDVTLEQVEQALGEMCNVVKNTYGDERGGFIAGQVYNYTGFVSGEGSFDSNKPADPHVVIATFWSSFEQHEASHANETFKTKFAALAALCTDTYELEYDMLWQGDPHG